MTIRYLNSMGKQAILWVALLQLACLPALAQKATWLTLLSTTPSSANESNVQPAVPGAVCPASTTANCVPPAVPNSTPTQMGSPLKSTA